MMEILPTLLIDATNANDANLHKPMFPGISFNGSTNEFNITQKSNGETTHVNHISVESEAKLLRDRRFKIYIC